jgi:hemolysin activation/secretion protein
MDRGLVWSWVSGLLALVALALPVAAQQAAPAKGQTPVKFAVQAFDIGGENPLGDGAQDALKPYLGEHAGLDGLVAAADALEGALAAAGYAFHRVSLPPQSLTGGRVKLQIVNFKVGKIEVKGQQHFSEENIRDSLPGLQSGQTPEPLTLALQLRAANEHPNKKVQTSFKESETPATVDVDLKVQDSRPWTAYTSLANTGSSQTGSTRITLGATHANLWDRDHALTLTYTTAPGRYDQVKQLGVNYAVPVYSESAKVSVLYSKSTVNSGRVADLFDVAGQGVVKGLRIDKKLPSPDTAYNHGLQFSLDDKFFNNDVTFAGVPIVPDVRSRPWGLRYDGEYKTQAAQFGFHVDYLRNTAAGRLNDDASYAASRGGARSDWESAKYGASLNYNLEDGWLLRGLLEGQWAHDPLIGGEQISAGGESRGRGYDAGVIAGDSGHYYSLELWAPPFEGGWRLLGFVDGGQMSVEDPVAGQNSKESIASAGAGLRWSYGQHLSLRADYGKALQAAGANPKGHQMVHFNVMLRY